MNGEPLCRWASTDVLAAVVDAELARFVGEGPTKGQGLLALAARPALEDQMRRHWWPAMEAVRKVGASWAEIATAAGLAPHEAGQLYEMTLARQKAFGYAQGHWADPGVPELQRVFGSRGEGGALAGGHDRARERVASTGLAHSPDNPNPSSPTVFVTASIAHPSATSPSSSPPRCLFNPRQTPLHRGCRAWASPVEVSV